MSKERLVELLKKAKQREKIDLLFADILKCADDIFTNYEPIRCVECENFFLTSHNKKRKTGKCKIGMRSCEGKGSIICSTYFKRRESNA